MTENEQSHPIEHRPLWTLVLFGVLVLDNLFVHHVV